MNANELADVLLSTKFQVDEDGTMIGVSHQAVNEAATMLRQQQADIELLEKALEQIATGEITGESTNYKDTVYVVRQIASDALTILRKAQEK